MSTADNFVIWTFILIALLLIVCWRDWRQGIIPDWVNAALVATGIVQAGLVGDEALADSIAGISFGLGVFISIRWAYFRWRGVHGLGLGDVKFFAAIGAWVGPFGLPSVLLAASFSGLVFALLRQFVQGRHSADSRLAFGPHLAIGTGAVWFYGPLGTGF